MKEFSPDKIPFIKLPCPFCGAKHPAWTPHDSYPRYLVSFEKGESITYSVEIIRLVCSSCGHAHAILPEIIIPHASYSLTFILCVLKDYFSKMKINDICDKYQISISMLYGWKQLFLRHKKLWLGILEDMYTASLSFLSTFPQVDTSKELSLFFTQTGDSFLQGVTKTAHCNSS